MYYLEYKLDDWKDWVIWRGNEEDLSVNKYELKKILRQLRKKWPYHDFRFTKMIKIDITRQINIY